MLPTEKDVREYARYASRTRQIVQEELTDQMEKPLAKDIMNELSRYATMPIGIWMNHRSNSDSPNHNSVTTIRIEERRDQLNQIISKYDLIDVNGFLKPRKHLDQEDFQVLRDAMWNIGYIYEIGAGFGEECTH